MLSPRHLLSIFVLMILVDPLISQTFTDIRAGLTGVAESTSGWHDADRDGDIDVVVMGEFYQSNRPLLQTRFYRNLRNDKFTYAASGIPDLYRGDFSFADYDLDGIKDVALIGELKGGSRIATIYKGLNGGTFAATGINFTPVRDGSIDFGDFDGDGDQDILITGESANGVVTLIYRNERNKKYTLYNNNLPGVRRGVARWIDFDLNGLLDVIITGISASGNGFSMLFENNLQGFVAINAGFTSLKNSNIAIGDVDNDGDDDVLFLGEINGGKAVTRLYRNDRTGGFSPVSVPFVGLKDGFADWGDMDHDGDLDLLLSGESANGAVSKVYLNERFAGYTDIRADIIPLYNSSGEWGDYDLDGDLDVIISGLSNDQQFISRVYRNDGFRAKVSTDDSRAMMMLQSTNPTRQEPIYFFVYSSAYTDLSGDGSKEYTLFIGPIKKLVKDYVMEEKFQTLIINTYPEWPRIDQGNIIQNGYPTMEEAKRAHDRVISEYVSKKFNIIKLSW